MIEIRIVIRETSDNLMVALAHHPANATPPEAQMEEMIIQATRQTQEQFLKAAGGGSLSERCFDLTNEYDKE